MQPRNQFGDLWRHPERHDQAILDVVIYPYDLEDRAGDTRFGFCLEAGCEPADVEGAYVETAPDRFRGWAGNRPIQIRMKFDAVCFTTDVICNPHYPFIFREVP